MMTLTGRRLSLSLLTALVFASPAASFAASSLYWVDTNYGAPKLNRSDENGVGITTVNLTAGTLPEGVAAWNDGRVTWTEAAISNARLMGVAYDLSNQVAAVSGQSVMRGVAVDELNHAVYWTTSNLVTGGAIWRQLPNGQPTSIVVMPSGANPRGIAVDPLNNRIFWTDPDLNRVYRANLDGTGVGIVVTLGPDTELWGIACQPGAQRLFLTDYAAGQLYRVNYDGSVFFGMLAGLANPTYLAVDLNALKLYWTEGGVGSQRIRKADINGANPITLPPVLSSYGGIAIGPPATAAVGDGDIAPPVSAFALAPPWPNPGRGVIHLAVSTPEPAWVRLAVFDVQGREVVLLADGDMPAGRHEINWDGTARGRTVPAGIYFARMTVGGESWVQRLVLAK